jgi:hypothetical protein
MIESKGIMEGLFSSELWRKNLEEYIVISAELTDAQGDKIHAYHIVNAVKMISHIIESKSEVDKIAARMIEAGVRVVPLDEALRILYPEHFT